MTGVPGAEFDIVPANEVPWEDLQTVFGPRGEAARCQCQWFKTTAGEFRELAVPELAMRLHDQTNCGDPAAPQTSGLVAYLGGEPVGWCAVEPRSAYVRLRTSRIAWSGRDEDPDDDGVWAVVCFVTRAGYRRRGVASALARAAVDFARERGARSIEGYPLLPNPDRDFVWGELYVGATVMFTDAGFAEVARPTPRRAVMRIDF